MSLLRLGCRREAKRWFRCPVNATDVNAVSVALPFWAMPKAAMPNFLTSRGHDPGFRISCSLPLHDRSFRGREGPRWSGDSRFSSRQNVTRYCFLPRRLRISTVSPGFRPNRRMTRRGNKRTSCPSISRTRAMPRRWRRSFMMPPPGRTERRQVRQTHTPGPARCKGCIRGNQLSPGHLDGHEH